MDEVEVFKALGDPTRLTILKLVKNKEKCICDIIPQTGKSQPNVSQHLKVLKISGLIKVRKQGTRILVSCSQKKIYDAIEIIHNL